MEVDFSTGIRDDRLIAIKNRIDNSGTQSGKLLFYTEAKPTPGDAITDQVLVGTARFTNTCGVVADQTLTFSFQTDTIQASNSGLIAWARITTYDDVWCCDLDASISGGNGAVRLDALQVFEGGFIKIVSAAFYEP